MKNMKMGKDRARIVAIVSRMLDNPDEHEIYPTSTAYTELEHYIESVRMETLGWAHGFFCAILDKGEDPRTYEVPKLIEKAIEQLSK